MLRDRRRRKRLFQYGEAILLFAGFICLGWVGYTYLETGVDQSYDNYQLDEMVHGRKPSVLGYLKSLMHGNQTPSVETPSAPPEDANTGQRPEEEQPVPNVAQQTPSPEQGRERTAPLKTRELVGRIEIPRLHIAAIVREGVDYKTLKHAVGHVPSTALPGHPGNVGIAAHRDTFFRNLRGVKKGDKIHMVTPDGNYDYEVDSLTIVKPSDVAVLAPTAQPALTLVTCYPFNYIGSAPKRFIVRAKQITTEAKAESSQKGS